MPIQIITRYDYDARAAVAPEVKFDPKKDKSLTNQADMDAADINKIMARYEKTGVLIDPLGVERKPMYGDFTEVKDYHAMLSGIRNVERAFGLLPVSVRNRFNNDPQALIEFLDDPKNDAEAVKMGLKDRRVLLTALDLDEKTPTTPEERASLDKLPDEKKQQRIAMLNDLRRNGIDPLTGDRVAPDLSIPPAPAVPAPGQPANPAA